ncbi:hypothetical protein V6N13_042995 [Hibiscus sabdariffa]|uniref:Uncharacterized protein n=1 Tax=Hibiscus sabdariffa TaxID=183260 RepID=A0ABR2G2X5_9ROSI
MVVERKQRRPVKKAEYQSDNNTGITIPGSCYNPIYESAEDFVMDQDLPAQLSLSGSPSPSSYHTFDHTKNIKQSSSSRTPPATSLDQSRHSVNVVDENDDPNVHLRTVEGMDF